MKTQLSIASLPLQMTGKLESHQPEEQLIGQLVEIEKKKKKKELSDLVPQKILQAEFVNYSETASFPPICYREVILQDAIAVSLSRTHVMTLMKNITHDNIRKTLTLTLIQIFMKIPVLFK